MFYQYIFLESRIGFHSLHTYSSAISMQDEVWEKTHTVMMKSVKNAIAVRKKRKKQSSLIGIRI
jgi:hypothetical protein